MDIYTTYEVKVKNHSKKCAATKQKFCGAEDFYIDVILKEWDDICMLEDRNTKYNHIESLTITTKKRPEVKYDFEKDYYKYPSYYRRATIAQAYGKVSSYKSNLQNWKEADPKERGKQPSIPHAGNDWPVLYKDQCYTELNLEEYTCKIKVWTNNTWDWIEIKLKKTDVEYIKKYCANRKMCSPKLVKKGKEWFLNFSFEEKAKLKETLVWEQTIIAVDLGINNACVCSAMKSDGTVLGRHFLNLPKENDCLEKALGRLIKAQKHGARHMPRLWGRVKGINNDIAQKTAKFIADIAVMYNVDVVVFEHLNTNGKKKGHKKQRIHLWKAQAVQRMVTDKVHRMGIHIARICAWGTSKLAYDGSGNVKRGEYVDGNGVKHYNYSVCTFTTGKQYNCDLNASYNIGARYFIREILKSLPEKDELALKAKVPELAKRPTCTLSSLIKVSEELRLHKLNAAL